VPVLPVALAVVLGAALAAIRPLIPQLLPARFRTVDVAGNGWLLWSCVILQVIFRPWFRRH
jgi:hypothetical protein